MKMDSENSLFASTAAEADFPSESEERVLLQTMLVDACREIDDLLPRLFSPTQVAIIKHLANAIDPEVRDLPFAEHEAIYARRREQTAREQLCAALEARLWALEKLKTYLPADLPPFLSRSATAHLN